MTYVRKFEHTDDHGDTLYVQHVTWTNEEDTEPETSSDDFLQIRTKQGRPVYLPMRVARELAGWLIEHAIDLPEPEPEPTIADEVRARAAASPVAVATGGLGGGGGMGGFAQGSGHVVAYGGQGGQGGSIHRG